MYLILIVTTVAMGFTACGPKKDDSVIAPGMMELDLSKNGLPISIVVPDSTKGKFEVITQSWGATEIKVGKNFQISITEGPGDIVLKKSDIKGDDINKLKRYLTDEPETILYESEITQPEFHFYSVIKIGNTSYIVEDIRGEMFNEKTAQTMVESAKSIKVKTPAES